jgi:DNA-binding IclR family transcriptional regulator
MSDYILRTVDALMREAGDAISGLVLLVLLAGALETDDAGRAAPQALSVRRIHQRLGLPEETVRRHLLDLAEEGDCERSGRGFAVTEAMLGRTGLRTLLADNETHVQRLLAGLAERGVIQAWEQVETGR